MASATPSRLLGPTTASCLIALLGLPLPLAAAALGDIAVRSYLGEPLRARVNLIASPDEEVLNLCYGVVSAHDIHAINPNYRVTLTDTRTSRFLTIEGRDAQAEPVVSLKLRAGCPDQSHTIREYSVALDPRPRDVPQPAPAIAPAPAPAPTVVVAAPAPVTVVSTEPYWVVRAGDSARTIAQGIYPKSRARQSAYIAALKAQNPEIAGIPDQDSLPEGLPLAMPNLKTLSGVAARAEAPRRAREPGAPREPRAAAPQRAAASASAPAARPERNSTSTAELKPPKSAPLPTTSDEGFRLKLSAAGVDVTRSAGVSEEARAKLREKLLLLDTDDHVAQLLSLRNTMRQMEARLVSLQTKLGAPAEALAITASVSQPAAKAETVVAEPPRVTPVLAPAASPTPPAVVEASAPPPASAPAPVVAKPETPAKAATPDDPNAGLRRIPAVKPPPSAVERFLGDPIGALTSTVGLSALGVGLLTALGGGLWWRSRRARPYDPGRENALISEARRQASSRQGAAAENFDHWAEEEKSAIAQLRGSAVTAANTQSPEAPRRVLDDTQTLLRKRAAAENVGATSSNDFSATLVLEPPSESTPAVMDVDLDAGSNRVDLRLDGDEPAKPDRSQRLKYMEERYPELAAKSASVEDPTSLINLARTYFREGYRVKACELLTWGIEERPQEIRFWLAQFEIFRLENLVPAFNTLAQKFQVLFGFDEAWAKVQHVGSVLDPTDELYHRNLDDPYPTARFDPLVDNWLNAPNESAIEPLSPEPPRLFGDALLTPQNIENISMRLSTLPTIKPT